MVQLRRNAPIHCISFSLLAVSLLAADIRIVNAEVNANASQNEATQKAVSREEFGAEQFAREKTALLQELRSQGIADARVLKQMRSVPRHLFVPENIRQQSYRNQPLPIGLNQTISQPYIVALMTELLEVEPTDKVLEIGTGSGYQAAVLSDLAAQVYTIEILPELGEQAKTLLSKIGYTNLHFRIGDGYKGWEEEAPFDKIIVTAAPKKIPQPLLDQLADGGRLVIPVGENFQELLLVTKTQGTITRKSVIPVRFVPMTGRAQQTSSENNSSLAK